MRRFCWGLLLAAYLPCSALAEDFDQGLATLWEVLWHQSGTPTRVVRWETDMRVRFHGINAASYRENMLQALRAVTAEAGIKLTDVSDYPNAEQLANVNVEITADNQLEDNQPCVTYLDFRTETSIDSAVIQMRSRDARRCAFHEAMHVMGVRGHPAGQTVLSYFPWKTDGLMQLDKVMLRAWYSPKMAGGMTPFEALPVLADELVATVPNKAAAAQARDLFYSGIIQQMHAYANGQGDIPAVVKRSGKATSEGIRYGRGEMSFFLGIAYMEGVTVQRDPNQGVRWLQRAATMGNRGAQAKLGAFRN
jgi:Sel1 repeat